MAGWIKMKLGTEVGLGPGDIVLYGDLAPFPKGHSPPIFCPCLLWPNGWMDQDATWYGDRPWSRQHCVRWGPINFPREGNSSPLFGPCLLWPNSRPSQLLMNTCKNWTQPACTQKRARSITWPKRNISSKFCHC